MFLPALLILKGENLYKNANREFKVVCPVKLAENLPGVTNFLMSFFYFIVCLNSINLTSFQRCLPLKNKLKGFEVYLAITTL